MGHFGHAPSVLFSHAQEFISAKHGRYYSLFLPTPGRRNYTFASCTPFDRLFPTPYRHEKAPRRVRVGKINEESPCGDSDGCLVLYGVLEFYTGPIGVRFFHRAVFPREWSAGYPLARSMRSQTLSRCGYSSPDISS